MIKRSEGWLSRKPTRIAVLFYEYEKYTGPESGLTSGGDFAGIFRDEFMVLYYDAETEAAEKDRIARYMSGEYSIGASASSSTFNGQTTTVVKRNYRVYDYKTGREAARFLFDNDRAAASDFDRWLVDTVIFELKDDPDGIRGRYSFTKLRGVALARLKENGFMVACGRCGGSGHYSYNQIDGTRCYGCNGQKVRLPRITKKWQRSVEEFDFRAALARSGE